MSRASVFQCPQCGASLSPQDDATQVQCAYCGTTVIVPEELRTKPVEPPNAATTPADLVQAMLAARQAAMAGRAAPDAQAAAPRRKSNPVASALSTVGCLLVIFLSIAAVGVLTDPEAQKSVAGLVAPTPTPLPINRPLQATLPRQVRYSNLVFTVKQATISNQDPNATNPARTYRSDQAYATLYLSIHNMLASKTVNLSAAVLQLQLGDGKLYQSSSISFLNFDPQSTREAQLIFKVPVDATWKDAKFILSEPNKEPAMLALDGSVPAADPAVALTAGGQATVEQVIYKIVAASLDPDADGMRANLGSRYLILSMHVTNNNTSPGGMALVPNDFRLLVDGEPLAPLQAPIELLNAASSKDGQVIFEVSAAIAHAELQVGEVGHTTAKIPLSLIQK